MFSKLPGIGSIQDSLPRAVIPDLFGSLHLKSQCGQLRAVRAVGRKFQFLEEHDII